MNESVEGAGFAELVHRQLGAFSRRQALLHGVSDRTLATRLRSGRIQRIYRGAYASFSGPVPWETRVWAAWLAYGPDAALGGETALRQYGLTGDWPTEPIHLELPHYRRVRRQPGIVVRRSHDFGNRLLGNREPPIVRLEVALLTVASRRSTTDGALSVLLDACRQHRTTPQRLLSELSRLPNLPRREHIAHVLRDADAGVESWLELVYLRKVERAHRLPAATRQAAETLGGTTIRRDCRYDEFGLIVELDGRAGHADVTSQWRDMARDNAAAINAKVTLRFGYQLAGNPCAAAAQVAAVLTLRGWRGTPTPCSPTCSVSSASRRGA
ncbi:type IV toxin-antitoxin system AbiEi family antitoxin domain-containing protein [Kribbella antibiotica]|uniref:type IV toxin-antitoxin system AbiEi family antitoxin domain-containing protein n=1 Tax=Kribbella antibiotica TaxID=190195 RepID=UPI001404EC23|nr:type IV toxin-antitoxin system AbiEi family antitoxin domain-containing protein [Kribbella antibiotica]